MKIERILFTGDFLRPAWDQARPTQHYNVLWCRDLLGRQIKSATGLPVEMAVWDAENVLSGGFDTASVGSIYGSFGLPLSIRSWAQVYSADTIPESAARFIEGVFDKALVVGFEMPPYLEHLLISRGIPYVDIIIHPIRFLDDIFLAVRTSSSFGREFLASTAISEEFIAVTAGLQSATARRANRKAVAENSGLLVLQTEFDRTQIQDGGFVGAADFLEEIRSLSRRYRKLYVKPHPLSGPNNKHQRAVFSAVPNAEVINDNIYTLLSSEGIREIVTLSSSVGIESKYFEKDVRFLLKVPNDFAVDGRVPENGEFVGVYEDALNADFWRDLLSGLLPVTRKSGVKIPFKPNRLRISLRQFWSFNQIDTNILAQAVDAKM